MKELKKEEMLKVEGGANGIFIASIVTTVITFVIGVFYVYSNPKTCNK